MRRRARETGELADVTSDDIEEWCVFREPPVGP